MASADYATELISIKRLHPNLSELHSDLLLKILVYATPHDVISVSLCCKQLYRVCNIDLLWRYILAYRYCHNVHPACLFLRRDAPYKYFVMRHYSLLYPVLGLWLLHLAPYNIVMKISHSDSVPYSLQGVMCYLDVNSRVSSHNIASFRVCQEEVNNSGEDKMPFRFDLTVLTDEQSYNRFEPCREFDLTYTPPQCGSVVCSISDFRCLQVADNNLFGHEPFTRIESRVSTKRAIHVSKISINKSRLPSNYILLPGIYEGAFSVGSPQLMLLYYQGGWLYCKKLTGDVNIPGGKVILKVRHRNINPSASSVPLDLSGEGTYTFNSELPYTKYVACYMGECQFAQRGFLYVSSCSGKMYVANEESFVFVTDWLNVSNFRRCNELSQFL